MEPVEDARTERTRTTIPDPSTPAASPTRRRSGSSRVEPLLTRKRERFGDDVRLVGHWQVRRNRGQLDIQMETRVSPALHTQLEAAGMR